jgi:hypothetical protein
MSVRTLGRHVAALALSAALATPLATPLAAQIRAFTLAVPGNRSADASLGIDFDVHTPIRVSALGTFASGGAEIELARFVRLQDRVTHDILGEILVAGDGQGTLIGGYRFQPLDAPVLLPVGFRGSIVEIGTGDPVPVYEVPLGGTFPGTIDTGGGAISFVGSREGPPGFTIFPDPIPGPPAMRFGAGNMAFTPVPEPATVACLAGGLLVLAPVVRRRARR